MQPCLRAADTRERDRGRERGTGGERAEENNIERGKREGGEERERGGRRQREIERATHHTHVCCGGFLQSRSERGTGREREREREREEEREREIGREAEREERGRERTFGGEGERKHRGVKGEEIARA